MNYDLVLSLPATSSSSSLLLLRLLRATQKRRRLFPLTATQLKPSQVTRVIHLSPPPSFLELSCRRSSRLGGEMMSRQCGNRALLAEGSRSGTVHGRNKTRGAASSSSRRRSHGVVRFHRCCVRAHLWRHDHLPLHRHAKVPARSEIKEQTVLQVSDILGSMKEWSRLHLVTVTGLVACAVLVVPSADATDALKTCTCLLKECRIELAKCIANPSCAANVACLNTCNNRPDETECQIKCGDLFENSVVDEFNECAVSRNKCVPRKSDVGEFPVPDPSALVKNFNMTDFNGKWYISSGLNPTFDTFDCQLHEFHVEGDKLMANITWRVRTPDTGFFTRSTMQRFVQDPEQPAILYNHDNEFLHYQDDWYIISSKVENKEDDYILVYYRGRNDAWDGYGGAVLYTRSKVVPETIVPELERAAKSIGRDFSTFIRTDNTCGPEPPLVERIEKTVEQGEKTIIREVQEIEGEIEGEVKELEEEEVTLFKRLTDGLMEVKQDVMNFLQGLSREEMEILDQMDMEATEVEKLFSRSLPIRKLR